MPEGKAREIFLIFQIAIGGLFLFLAWFFFRPREKSESRFRVREADLHSGQHSERDLDLANARFRDGKSALLLEGIRLDLPPHELLGVPAHASRAEIQKAYRELMKRYHPDRVARVDSPQWVEAQRIAEAINRAKEQLLKQARG